jgi:hypothetical protein
MEKQIENSTDNVNSGNGFGYGYAFADIPARTATLQNTSNLRYDVARAESEIKGSIHDQSLGHGEAFRDSLRESFESRLEAVKSGYEARLENKESKFDIITKVDREADIIKMQIREFRHDVDRRFCETNKNIDDKFAQLEIRDCNDKVAELRLRVQELQSSRVDSGAAKA